MAGHAIEITDDNFTELVEKASLPVLLDFWGEYCPPCKALAPIIESLAVELAGKVLVGKVNVEQNRNLAMRFQITGVPTLYVLKNGQPVGRKIGAVPKAQILAMLREHAAIDDSGS